MGKGLSAKKRKRRLGKPKPPLVEHIDLLKESPPGSVIHQ